MQRASVFWSAGYAYKGGWELSGLYYTEEAARYSLQKINAQLHKDMMRP
jgi:hypothetical protein